MTIYECPSGSKLKSTQRVKPKPKTRPSNLPFVLVNMSMTADGKIATANRAVSSFGSKRDHDHLLALRATADAVMCGARTVDLNKVTLGTGGMSFRRFRLKRGLAPHHLRIIVSGSGSLNTKAHIFSLCRLEGTETEVRDRTTGRKDQHPIIILTTARAGKQRLAKLRALADDVKAFGKTELDLRAALVWLREQWKVKRLICEGGGELNDAMFQTGLVDELHLTLCPRIIGGRNAQTIAGGAGFQKLALAAQLQLVSARRVGDELFLVYRSCKSPR